MKLAYKMSISIKNLNPKEATLNITNRENLIYITNKEWVNNIPQIKEVLLIN